MVLKKDDFSKILHYVSDYLLAEVISYPVRSQNVESVLKSTIHGLTNALSVESFLASIKEKKERVKKDIIYSEGFETWWNNFPKKAEFTQNKITFASPRILRDDKEKTYNAYLKAKEKHSLADEGMLLCLLVELRVRKNETLKKNNPVYNSFTYMKASVAYLNDGKFSYRIGEQMQEEYKIKQDLTEISI